MVVKNRELCEIKDKYDDFEEIPIISRPSKLCQIQKENPKIDLSDVLMEIALCILQLQLKNALGRGLRPGQDILFAITVCDWWDEFNDEGFVVPSLLVSRKPELFEFLKNISENWYDKTLQFADVYRNRNLFLRYNGFHTVSNGPGWRVDRLYLFPKVE